MGLFGLTCVLVLLVVAHGDVVEREGVLGGVQVVQRVWLADKRGGHAGGGGWILGRIGAGGGGCGGRSVGGGRVQHSIWRDGEDEES